MIIKPVIPDEQREIPLKAGRPESEDTLGFPLAVFFTNLIFVAIPFRSFLLDPKRTKPARPAGGKS